MLRILLEEGQLFRPQLLDGRGQVASNRSKSRVVTSFMQTVEELASRECNRTWEGFTTTCSRCASVFTPMPCAKLLDGAVGGFIEAGGVERCGEVLEHSLELAVGKAQSPL